MMDSIKTLFFLFCTLHLIRTSQSITCSAFPGGYCTNGDNPCDSPEYCLTSNCNFLGGGCYIISQDTIDTTSNDDCEPPNNECLFDCPTLAEDRPATCEVVENRLSPFSSPYACRSKCAVACVPPETCVNPYPDMAGYSTDSKCYYDAGARCMPPPIVLAPGSIECMYAGQMITGNTTITLNAGDTLMIQCRAHGGSGLAALANSRVPGFIVSKTAPPSTATVTLSTGGTPTVLTTDTGNLIYDTVNGNADDFEHVVVRSHMPIYTKYYVASGNMLLYIPAISTYDQGSYYITFMDGADYTNVKGTYSLTVSPRIDLQVNTKSSSGTSLKAGFLTALALASSQLI